MEDQTHVFSVTTCHSSHLTRDTLENYKFSVYLKPFRAWVVWFPPESQLKPPGWPCRAAGSTACAGASGRADSQTMALQGWCQGLSSQLTGQCRQEPVARDASNPAVTGQRRGGAAGGAPDVRHQPPGTTIFIYCNYGLNHNNAASILVKASCMDVLGSNPDQSNFLLLYYLYIDT